MQQPRGKRLLPQRCSNVDLDKVEDDAEVVDLRKVRSLRCSCPSPLCPVGAARRLFENAKVKQFAGDLPDQRIPLSADVDGAPVSKISIVKAFKALSLTAWTPASVRITGHSCRVTGAQRRAAAARRGGSQHPPSAARPQPGPRVARRALAMLPMPVSASLRLSLLPRLPVTQPFQLSSLRPQSRLAASQDWPPVRTCSQTRLAPSHALRSLHGEFHA